MLDPLLRSRVLQVARKLNSCLDSEPPPQKTSTCPSTTPTHYDAQYDTKSLGPNQYGLRLLIQLFKDRITGNREPITHHVGGNGAFELSLSLHLCSVQRPQKPPEAGKNHLHRQSRRRKTRRNVACIRNGFKTVELTNPRLTRLQALPISTANSRIVKSMRFPTAYSIVSGLQSCCQECAGVPLLGAFARDYTIPTLSIEDYVFSMQRE
ncbi:uncharacterized protein F5Z01DRAFT_639581 [Emericellopsis atlantica]|uniref:Uncharacterized protein n=1 Tax=Emericellopsis atlantica TaxID=2614577 RepID=A0A9P7ZG97_9HYPO|nr:uncharacterized protein F5Z01DRAFT_639581 [Emericellopsis atlantica]KAG9251181.1 hypothetical protein F5Z01DRAFT_639581 [Emericellopsis atlantica]